MEFSTQAVPILLVDDIPANILALEAVLKSPRYKLSHASSGKEALEQLKLEDYAVILLDVQMPIMDGFETALRIRQNFRTKNIPIIFITASIETSGMVFQGYEAGAIDYIFKPFEPNILRSKVSVLADLYIARKELDHRVNLIKIQDEKNIASVLENALDAVISMSSEGRIISWNAQAMKIFGWSKDEVIGKMMSQTIIPPDYREKHERGLMHFLNTGEGPILNKRIEITAIRRDENEFPIELTVTPLFSNGAWTFTAFLRDISERKKIQEEKEKLLEEYKHALEFRDTFINICSHELNTPITSMKLQFQMAERAIKKGDQSLLTQESILRRVNIANHQLDRMTNLIKDMLDVTKISDGSLSMNFDILNFKDMVDETVDMLKEEFNSKKIELTYEAKITSAFLKADKYRLEQVIMNLMTNAFKYGLGKPVKVTLETVDDLVVLSVEDHGLGLSQNSLETIFNKYQRAVSDDNIGGLGIGLYITKQIVKAHNGRIEVSSVLGQGSTFKVLFPTV